MPQSLGLVHIGANLRKALRQIVTTAEASVTMHMAEEIKMGGVLLPLVCCSVRLKRDAVGNDLRPNKRDSIGRF